MQNVDQKKLQAALRVAGAEFIPKGWRLTPQQAIVMQMLLTEEHVSKQQIRDAIWTKSYQRWLSASYYYEYPYKIIGALRRKLDWTELRKPTKLRITISRRGGKFSERGWYIEQRHKVLLRELQAECEEESDEVG